jgi:hypothetical protein
MIMRMRLSRMKVSKCFNCRLKDLQYLIIDEVSNVSCSLLQFMSVRLQRARKNFLSFGGVSVILAAEFYQLRPPFGRPLWTNPEQLELFDRNGASLFLRFSLCESRRTFRFNAY